MHRPVRLARRVRHQRTPLALATVVLLVGSGLIAAGPTAEVGQAVERAAGHQQSMADLAQDSIRTDLTRERFYFVMSDRFANGDRDNDTGGIEGGRLDHGYDPTDQAFYHGGDLAGVRKRLDYIEDLGTTAIWLTPSFVNRPVLGKGRTRKRRTTATGSPTSPGSTRTWAPTRR